MQKVGNRSDISFSSDKFIQYIRKIPADLIHWNCCAKCLRELAGSPFILLIQY